ncbi:type IV secretory system conjugative DNA transfer family protein [Alicyclobacillus sp. SP_1]|uniref:type IV secretory system conjugative DNA transfer family protein n=1 Tax=Alicyclobacillus sp. SP_1 TaxID=2942475 RepID=UPI002156F860|nr:type IV secretory system conjugative DNA transfer family protein [Alicyclobacillus sp. SP_1]
MPINVALDAELLTEGIHHYRAWNFESVPHAIVVGPTGSGKTFLVKLVLARIGLRVRNASVVLCDFKAEDFHFLAGAPNHYEFLDCLEGLDRYYKAFLARQRGEDTCRDFRLLVFDEWAAFLNTIDKKEADAARLKLSTLLMLGRSRNIHILNVQQRADAETFAKGSRDNFGLVVALGNLSKESASMFGFDRDMMQPVSGVGSGHMLINGTDMAAIKVPTVRDVARMEAYIRRVVARPL